VGSSENAREFAARMAGTGLAVECPVDRTRIPSKARALRRIAAVVAGATVLAGGGLALARIDFSTHRIDLSKITLATVQHGTLEVKVAGNGRLLARNLEYITSQVTGRVAKVYVKAGDAVDAGQLLVELTNPQLVAGADEAYSAWQGATLDLKAAEAQSRTDLLDQQAKLNGAEFAAQKAQLQLAADERLMSERAMPELEYKRSRLSVAQLTRAHAIEQARLLAMQDSVALRLAAQRSHATQLARALDRARSDAASLRVVAGIRGVVQAIGVDIGQQLQPGSPAGQIAQLDDLYAELRLPAREASEVQVGQSAVIDTRNGVALGKVARIDPGVSNGTVTVDVDLRGPLPPGARPQLPIDGVVLLLQVPEAVYVARPSYVRSNGVISVYKLDPSGHYAGRAQIKTGKLSLDVLQVLDGLSPGDRIITSEIGEWERDDRVLLD
jgi:HlyD family secretion protein